MPDITIPEAAVEAAARTAWEMNRDDPRWFSFDQLTATDRGLVKGDAYTVLAAAPHIAAQALRDAAQAWQINGWADALPHGSDRPSIIIGMAQRSANWLRDRADQIEATNG